MAKKNFNIDIRTKGKDLSEVADKIDEISDESKEAIYEFVTSPDHKGMIRVKQAIENDELLQDNNKKLLIKKLQDDYLSLFNFDNCPDDYNELKMEVKFLSDINTHSFLIMAQRLLKIRDERLYEKDRYANFKAFIDNELNIKRSSVYEYMDIVKFFVLSNKQNNIRVKATLSNDDFEYSKLTPFIPLFKSEKIDIPKEELREQILDMVTVGKKTYELRDYAKNLKDRYGLSVKNDTKEEKKESEFIRLIDLFASKIPDKLTDDEKRKARELIDKLNKSLEMY